MAKVKVKVKVKAKSYKIVLKGNKSDKGSKKPWFRIEARNGRIICHSQMYEKNINMMTTAKKLSKESGFPIVDERT